MPILPIIITDKIKLKTTRLNLLANAIKFTKKGKVNLEINYYQLKQANKAKVEILYNRYGNWHR